MSAPLPRRASQAGDWPDARDFFSHTLRRLAGRGPSTALALLTVPAPLAPPTALLSAKGPTLLWEPREGPSQAGTGCAVELSASGPGRIAQVREQASALWPRIESFTHPATTPQPARLFGGLAFSEGAAARAPWDGFGDARFVLPRWLYTRDGEEARLSLAVDLARGGEDLATAAEEYARLLDSLEAASRAPEPSGPPAARLLAREELDRERWRRAIEDILASIDTRGWQKVVAARCSRLELAEPIDPAAVLAALARRYPHCFRFGYRFASGALFLGASPERLIELSGLQLETVALAGSLAVGPGDDSVQAARRLLASGKDRGEQHLVTRLIEQVLAPLCAELHVPAQPSIRVLPRMLHLESPIRGRLRQPMHVLELVEALHPTPAVGGMPKAHALEWIARNEPTPRGWYAAPVGWFDAGGGGQFAVAIRCGLVHERTAHLYAGAGIVRGSDAQAEYAETQHKLGALLGALGLAP